MPCTVTCLPGCLKSWFRLTIARYLDIKATDLKLKQDGADITDSYDIHLRKARRLIASSGNITGYKQKRQDDKEVEVICKKL